MKIYKIAQDIDTLDKRLPDELETKVNSDYYNKIRENVYASLNPEELDILRMREGIGVAVHSFKDIANSMGMSSTWVTDKYRRALRKLRAVYSSQFNHISEGEFMSVVLETLLDEKGLKKSYRSQWNENKQSDVDSLKNKRYKIQKKIDYYLPMFQKWQSEVDLIDVQIKQLMSERF